MKRERKRVYGWWCLKYDVMRIRKKSWLLFYNEQNTYVYTTDGRGQDDLEKIYRVSEEEVKKNLCAGKIVLFIKSQFVRWRSSSCKKWGIIVLLGNRVNNRSFIHSTSIMIVIDTFCVRNIGNTSVRVLWKAFSILSNAAASRP